MQRILSLHPYHLSTAVLRSRVLVFGLWMVAVAAALAGFVAIARLWRDGEHQLAVLLTVMLGVVLAPLILYRHEALRWLTPALLLLVALIAYPAVYVGYLAFTNYSTDHPVSKQRSIALIEAAPSYQIAVPGSRQYRYAVYQDDGSGELLVLLTGHGAALVGGADGTAAPLAALALEGRVPLPDGAWESVVDPASLAVVPEMIGGRMTETVPSLDAVLAAPEAHQGRLVFDTARGAVLDLTGDAVPTATAAAILLQDASGETALWALTDRGGVVYQPDGTVTETDLPPRIDGHDRLPLAQALSGGVISRLSTLELVLGDNVLRLNPSDPTQFGSYQPRYLHSAETDVFVDALTGARYAPVDGTFVLVAGSADPSATATVREELAPGFTSHVGWLNFQKLLGPDQIGTILDLVVWSVLFSAIAVVTSYLLGLLAAILLDDPLTPFRGTARALLVLPYAMPIFLSVPMWRLFLDPQLGAINEMIAILGLPFQPNWTGQATAARAALIIVMTWIFFPYFMLVAGGTLKSIDQSLYDAARVDGAGRGAQFRSITLPLVTIACGPILVATFAFFFTNVTVIQLFLRGGPGVASVGPAYGSTDILASFAYRQAFPPAGDADFAYAAAVAVTIFLMLACLGWLQNRLTRRQEA